MKTILLTLATVLVFSCSPSDDATPTDCTKGTIIKSEVSKLDNSTDFFSEFTVKNDCTGQERVIGKVGVYKVGDKY